MWTAISTVISGVAWRSTTMTSSPFGQTCLAYGGAAASAGAAKLAATSDASALSAVSGVSAESAANADGACLMGLAVSYEPRGRRHCFVPKKKLKFLDRRDRMSGRHGRGRLPSEEQRHVALAGAEAVSERDGSDLPRLGRAEKIIRLATAFGVEPE